MLIIVGVMLVAAANDLVLVFLGLELISIPTYVLLFLSRKDRSAAEATAKYFFLGIFSSAILLYGFSFLYGIGGSTQLAETGGIAAKIAELAAGGKESGHLPLLPVALVLIFAGLGFKIAAVPFHFYAPDVYQGASNAAAGLLAVAPKIAGIVALVRLAGLAMPAASQFAWQLAIVLAVFTMTLGNVCALWQQNVRRLMAYSSVAHAGYMLIGLAVALASGATETGTGVPGVAALLFYLAVYVAASTGTFAALTYLGRKGREVSDVEELAGVGKTAPWAGAVIALCMFSLAGIPPLVGFWGKFGLFAGAVGLATQESAGGVSLWFAILAVVGALNAAIAAAYYLRIVGVMYFRSAPSEAREEPPGGWGA
jgi:NADH-quinone oxidoreductase subunit N